MNGNSGMAGASGTAPSAAGSRGAVMDSTPNNPMLEAALGYAAHGWEIFPAPPGEKKSHKSAEHSNGKRWGATKDPEQIRRDWRKWPGANVGIPTGPDNGFFVLEADTIAGGHAADGNVALRDLESKHGPLPETLKGASPSGSVHCYFKYPDGIEIKNSASTIAPGIDIRGDGGMVIAPPSVKPEVGRYVWLSDAPIADAPQWVLDKIADAAKRDDVQVLSISDRALALVKTPTGALTSNKRLAGWAANAAKGEADAVAGTMKGGRNARLNLAAFNLGRIVGAGALTETEVNERLFVAATANGSIKDDGRKAALDTIKSGLTKGIKNPRPLPDLSDYVNAAPAEANVVRLVTEAPGAGDAGGGDAGDDDDEGPPSVQDSEFALADEFITDHKNDLRYIAKFGKWQAWHGAGWQQDETVRVFDLARRICRRAAANKEKAVAKSLSKARTVAAVEQLARSYRAVAATVDQWDTHPMKFNTPSGTIDLTTGNVLPHNRLDYITKIAACGAAERGTPHPIWTTFLMRIMVGDVELIAFLQRYMGYCLTGDVSEHRFVFGYGGGGNGKGTFINTFVKIFGDYATISNPETFMETQNERHTTEIAKLRGARLVVAQEVDEGKQWNESRIKAATGGDRMVGRFMRQDDIEFDPEFKLFMAGNNQPTLKNVDAAMRRRLMLVPFTIDIPEDEQDHDLAAKLEAEWPAILRWAVDGCLEWQRIGLAPPDAVKEATNEYFAEQDTFTLWLEEACVVDTGNPDKWEYVGELYDSWAAYSTKGGGKPPSTKSFSVKMKAKAFVPFREGHSQARAFRGIRLRLTATERNFGAQ